MTVNKRRQTLFMIVALLVYLLVIIGLSFWVDEAGLATNLLIKNQAPSGAHPFGTDWLGRDMLTRTLLGLRTSLLIGAVTTVLSLVISLGLTLLIIVGGKKADQLVTGLITIFMSLPNTLAVIMISLALGRGFKGVVIGIGLTHWAHFTRILRGQVTAIKDRPYIAISRHFGKTNLWIAARHMLPHLTATLSIGFTQIFAGAIIHEAAITFLGFGLSPHQPSIGMIFAESMTYLSQGMWWLVLLPGLALFLVTLAIYEIGDQWRQLSDPHQAQL